VHVQASLVTVHTITLSTLTALYISIYSYYYDKTKITTTHQHSMFYSPAERPNATPTTLLSPTTTRQFTLSSYECCSRPSKDVEPPLRSTMSNVPSRQRCRLSTHDAECSLRSTDAECPSAYHLYTVHYSLDNKGRSPRGAARFASQP